MSTSTRQHPIQRIRFCPATSTLFTASGHRLSAFDPSSGDLRHAWSAPKPSSTSTTTSSEGAAKSTPVEEGEKPSIEAGEPKSKKRKLELRGKLKKKTPATSSNTIFKVLTTKDGRYTIATTGEDKAVRVWEWNGKEMTVVSERILPKRPIDLSLIEPEGAEAVLLIADKFGDVWELPLLDPTYTSSSTVTATEEPAPTSAASPTPSTKSKSKAQMEEEEKAAELRRQRTGITYDLPYKYRLVLGHVSMLLSLTTFTTTHNGKPRSYILTGDRDEHIRVSRYPQGYVIENFCFGHTSFVSQLLIPSWAPDTLVSGGGDSHLLVWDWKTETVKERVELLPHVQALLPGTGDATDVEVEAEAGKTGNREERKSEEPPKLAVTKLYPVASTKQIAIGIERIPVLLLISTTNPTTEQQLLNLSGNILDVALVGEELWVSVDAPHLLEIYLLDKSTGKWSLKTDEDPVLKKIVEQAVEVVDIGDNGEDEEDVMEGIRENVLYTVGSLRKGFREDEQ